MSEHMSINGEIYYWHLPYDEVGAFTYCNHCKKTLDRATIEFHNGIASDWMVLRCPNCKKAIWTSELERKPTKDNKKCAICKEPTNWIDCEAHGESFGSKKHDYWCSKKCYDKNNKIEEETAQK